ATRQGVHALSLALAARVSALRAAAPVPVATRVVLRPRAVNEPDFVVTAQGTDGFLITGSKPLRWVRQTDFTNDEAIGFLADRLARLGVEKELARLGATPGVEVTIGDVSFEWEPTLSGGGYVTAADGQQPAKVDPVVDDEIHLGPRGSDDRLRSSVRLTRSERMARAERARGFDPSDPADPAGLVGSAGSVDLESPADRALVEVPGSAEPGGPAPQ
ncbi:Obg family GTPase CgtA, partial [Candidatus Frankia nodulisporulans]